MKKWLLEHKKTIGSLLVLGMLLSILPVAILHKNIFRNQDLLDLGPVIVCYLLIVAVLILLTTVYSYFTFASLYGIGEKKYVKKLGFALMQLWTNGRETSYSETKAVATGSLFSFFLMVYCYSLVYLYLGHHLEGYFDKSNIAFTEAFYLSFTAASVGPAGLEPTSTLARWIVLSEVLIGTGYSILVLSLIAEILREKIK